MSMRTEVQEGEQAPWQRNGGKDYSNRLSRRVAVYDVRNSHWPK
jgi:hypothetical protein